MIRKFLLGVFVAAFAVLGFVPTPAHAAANPSITVLDRMQPGSKNAFFVSNIDFSKGSELHAFGQTVVQNSGSGYQYQTFDVPRDTAPNSLHILTLTQHGKTLATYYAWVDDFYPWVTPSKWYSQGGEGDFVTFSAPNHSFMRGEVVKLYANGQYTGSSAQAGATGPIFYDNQGALKNTLIYPIVRKDAGTTIHFEFRGEESHRQSELWLGVANKKRPAPDQYRFDGRVQVQLLHEQNQQLTNAPLSQFDDPTYTACGFDGHQLCHR